MIEVLITNIQSETDGNEALQHLTKSFPSLVFNFDIQPNTQPFPCGHSVLRIQGPEIKAKEIISSLQSMNIQSSILLDKVCI